MRVNLLPVSLTFKDCVHDSAPISRPISFQIWNVDAFCLEKEQGLSVMQPEVIYTHARDYTSGF